MSHVVFLPVVLGASLGKPIPFHFHIELSHSSNQLHLMFQYSLHLLHIQFQVVWHPLHYFTGMFLLKFPGAYHCPCTIFSNFLGFDVPWDLLHLWKSFNLNSMMLPHFCSLLIFATNPYLLPSFPLLFL